jgi:uncharacterized iron-regulated protein
MKNVFLCCLIVLSVFSDRAQAAAQLPQDMQGADVMFLGEVHDNPEHHLRQAWYIRASGPRAVVWEMLSPDQAEALNGLTDPDIWDNQDALAALLGWATSGWPDFALYYPVFSAAREAEHYGAAVPREKARAVMGRVTDGAAEGIVAAVADTFGDGAARFGLTDQLPAAQQSAREDMQLEAHCNALPQTLLPMMVGIQRLRDAALARAAYQAHEQQGGAVVVITGNGHARKDWGAPALLALAAPELEQRALGQGEHAADGTEGSAPDGLFDLTEFSPPALREDPCAAFQ